MRLVRSFVRYSFVRFHSISRSSQQCFPLTSNFLSVEEKFMRQLPMKDGGWRAGGRREEAATARTSGVWFSVGSRDRVFGTWSTLYFLKVFSEMRDCTTPLTDLRSRIWMNLQLRPEPLSVARLRARKACMQGQRRFCQWETGVRSAGGGWIFQNGRR